jgi:hypothetical protein
MAATAASIEIALAPSEGGQKPRTLPASGFANVTSKSTATPIAIFAALGILAILAPAARPLRLPLDEQGDQPSVRSEVLFYACALFRAQDAGQRGAYGPTRRQKRCEA